MNVTPPPPIDLGFESMPGIAVGAYLNNRICITHGRHAYMSQHIGDLDTRGACESFAAEFARGVEMLHGEAQWIAADLHPDFYSARFGCAFADAHRLPFIAVQHHHAHIAAVIAEHRLDGDVLGLALDGFGFGSDGGAWGGELLRVGGAQAERLGHLQPLPLPGGDRAAREPWRMAAAALFELGKRDAIGIRFGASSAPLVTMIEKGLNSPRTSSAGRLFDAAAGLLGIEPDTDSEGQAAIMLERLAATCGSVEPLPHSYSIDDDRVLSMLPTLAFLADADWRELSIERAAAMFHANLAAALAAWTLSAAHAYRIDTIALSGGCFHNRILSQALRARLEAQQLKVFEAVQVSPGDGGLSLGQAWIAQQLQWAG